MVIFSVTNRPISPKVKKKMHMCILFASKLRNRFLCYFYFINTHVVVTMLSHFQERFQLISFKLHRFCACHIIHKSLLNYISTSGTKIPICLKKVGDEPVDWNRHQGYWKHQNMIALYAIWDLLIFDHGLLSCIGFSLLQT